MGPNSEACRKAPHKKCAALDGLCPVGSTVPGQPSVSLEKNLKLLLLLLQLSTQANACVNTEGTSNNEKALICITAIKMVICHVNTIAFSKLY